MPFVDLVMPVVLRVIIVDTLSLEQLLQRLRPCLDDRHVPTSL